jgi:general secretion pathway protein C
MASRLLTFAVWALVAGSGLFWGLRLFVQAPGLPDSAQAPASRVALGGDLGRLLGMTEQPSEDEEPADDGAGKFQLLGVVAPPPSAHSSQGVALIAVGGQPAKAYRTGAKVDDTTVLLSVSRRGAELGPHGGPAVYSLALPEPAPAATVAPGAVPGRPPLPGAPIGGVPGHPGMRPMVSAPAVAPPPQSAGDGTDEED